MVSTTKRLKAKPRPGICKVLHKETSQVPDFIPPILFLLLRLLPAFPCFPSVFLCWASFCLWTFWIECSLLGQLAASCHHVDLSSNVTRSERPLATSPSYCLSHYLTSPRSLPTMERSQGVCLLQSWRCGRGDTPSPIRQELEHSPMT